MKKIIKYLILSTLILFLGIVLTPREYMPQAFGQVQTKTYTYLNHVFKKSVIIGTTGNTAANSGAWLQIGDSAGARYHLYFPPTDTGKIAIANRKFGHFVFNASDTTFYLWAGDEWRSVAYTHEIPE